ncbi:hypothetical protein Tco_1090593 [Tanacetum coccineum]|uniref:Uncharacterized protein n=1 Tax=Tanacetum coccineum TaxID=301880 RepID=A0ABQ5I4Q4_9ASTR
METQNRGHDIQLQDYALWEIYRGSIQQASSTNHYKPVDGTSTSIIPGAVIAEEKIQKKNDLKAQKARFGGNEATKKTQKTLLKQMYENFNASSSESLDFTLHFYRKIVSPVSHLKVKTISPEDLNFKFLRRLPSEWSMHVVVWRNKPDLGSISFDDLYNNFKIVEQEVECYQLSINGHFTERVGKNPKDQEIIGAEIKTLKGDMNEEETLQSYIPELNKSEFDLANYKRGLASVEEQLVFYKKNEGILCDQIVVLKRDASFNESEINALKIQIERLKKEKESNQIKIHNFENASKSLDKLIGCQISYNNRKSVGYNVVSPPPTGLFSPPAIDLSNSGLEEFKQPEFKGYGVKVNKSVSENSSNEIKKTSGALIIEDWVSDCNEDETVEKELDFSLLQKLVLCVGSFNHLIKDYDFHDKRMVQKPVLNNEKMRTGQRKVRPVWNNAIRTNHQNFSNSRRNFAPTAVLTKSELAPISAVQRQKSQETLRVYLINKGYADLLKMLELRGGYLGLFSTAGDIQDTDEELAKKVHEEEQTKILEQKEQEIANLEAALNLQKLFDQERKATDDIAWSKIVEQAQLKISGVGNITEAYQGFEDMLKAFDREDLDTLWSLVKEKFRSVEPNEDMERALWVELKRIYEPDKEDTLFEDL